MQKASQGRLSSIRFTAFVMSQRVTWFYINSKREEEGVAATSSDTSGAPVMAKQENSFKELDRSDCDTSLLILLCFDIVV